MEQSDLEPEGVGVEVEGDDGTAAEGDGGGEAAAAATSAPNNKKKRGWGLTKKRKQATQHSRHVTGNKHKKVNYIHAERIAAQVSASAGPDPNATRKRITKVELKRVAGHIKRQNTALKIQKQKETAAAAKRESRLISRLAKKDKTIHKLQAEKISYQKRSRLRIKTLRTETQHHARELLRQEKSSKDYVRGIMASANKILEKARAMEAEAIEVEDKALEAILDLTKKTGKQSSKSGTSLARD